MGGVAVDSDQQAPRHTAGLRLLAGGVAGSVAKTVVAPFERAKILFQATDTPFSARAVRQTIEGIVRKQGWLGLWRGNWASVARIGPYAAVQLASFDFLKTRILEHRRNKSPGGARHLRVRERLAAGATAGAASVIATYPLDVVRVRLAVQLYSGDPSGHYRGVIHAMRSVAAEGLGSMYRGLGPSIVGILPYASISLATNETLKAWVSDRHGGQPPPTWQSLLIGGVAGLLGQTASYPFDTVRRRQQSGLMDHKGRVSLDTRAMHSAAGAGVGAASEPAAAARQPLFSHSAVAVARHVVATHGWKGLWKGVTLNWVKGPIAVAISFTVFDSMKRALGLQTAAL